MDQLLRRLSSFSGEEYGLLDAVVQAGFLPREQLVAWVQQVVDDRLALAEAYLRHAQACNLEEETECRQAISRAYYACHHAGLALVYDVQRRHADTHEAVIAGVSQIVGQQAAREIRRLHRLRNQVEYQLYLPNLEWRIQAEGALTQAREFMNECRVRIMGRR